MTLYCGDCLEVMRALPADSVSAIVTDPPAGISFMNASWDHHKGGRRPWVAWMTEVMQEALRVAKPGAHMLCWALPRTSHWTATAIEDAGWEIRDVITHIFASGFPKSLDVGKAIDKMAGAEREVVDVRMHRSAFNSSGPNQAFEGKTHARAVAFTAPATDAARQWDGWGTALKPAAEHWILARKPLSEPTVAANVLRWGCGALNIDKARIGGVPWKAHTATGLASVKFFTQGDAPEIHKEPHAAGRWPANVVLSHSAGCVEVGTRTVKTGDRPHVKSPINTAKFNGKFNNGELYTNTSDFTGGYAAADGTETVPAWECAPDCPVRLLDEQAGERKSGKPTGVYGTYAQNGVNAVYGKGLNSAVPNTAPYGDTGSASRFFFIAKPSRREREQGLQDRTAQRVNDGRDTPIDNPYQRGETPRQNTHPTVKSTALMRHLLTLVVPPAGVVLDPFTGSGSTGVAAAELGLTFIGIERERDYYEIARARIEDAELRMEAERVLPLFSYGGIEL